MPLSGHLHVDGSRVLARARVLLLLTGLVPTLVAAEPAGPAAVREVNAPASLRLVHLSSDAPQVDVLIDGRLTVRNLSFATRSEVLTSVPGRRELRVFPHRPPRRPPEGAGATTLQVGIDAPRPTPLEPVTIVLHLPAGTLTTVVLTGSYQPLADEQRRGQLSLQVAPADAEIRLEGPRGYSARLQGDQFLVGLEPGPYRVEARRPDYQSAEYEIEVAPETTAIVTITLQRGEPEGDAGEGPPAEALLMQREGAWHGLELQAYRDTDLPVAPAGSSLVRFVHGAPTLPPLDLEATLSAPGDAGPPGDAGVPAAADLAVDGLAYPNVADYTEVPARGLRLELRVAGTRSVVSAVDEIAFAPGATYTVFVSADPVTNEVWLVPLVDAVVPQSWPGGGPP